MDGYVRIYTDEEGKFVDCEDYWGRTEDIECEIADCINSYLRDYLFHPNSLILLTLNLKTRRSYNYYSRCCKYDTNIEIKNEIVLVENYEPQTIEDRIEENEIYQELFNSSLNRD